MTEYHGLQHFKRGISTVSQWTGTEHKEMQRVLLGVIAGAVEPRVFKATRAILDFIYYAQYHSHTDETLKKMEDALGIFHANKEVFIELGIRENFNIPKLHSLRHYMQSIRDLGTADGFNSESPERLHIDFAKDAYAASSKVDYIAQMTHWLEIQKAVDRHSAYLNWVASQNRPPDLSDELDSDDDGAGVGDHDEINEINYDKPDNEPAARAAPSKYIPSGLHKSHRYRVTKTCPLQNISVSRLHANFGALDFLPTLQAFLT